MSSGGDVKPSCPHLVDLDVESRVDLHALIQNVRQKWLSEGEVMCEHEQCEGTLEAKHALICLNCSDAARPLCGRYKRQHSLEHYSSTSHALSVSLGSSLVWCYECDDEAFFPLQESSERQSSQSPREELNAARSREEESLSKFGISRARAQLGVKDDQSWRFRSNVSGGLVGFSNLGNTCFLSSGLQLLVHVPEIITIFAQHAIISEDNVPTTKRELLVKNFARLLLQVWNGRYSSIAPRDLVRDIWSINAIFRGFEQQDSQEFLRCIIDNLHEGMKHQMPQVEHVKRSRRPSCTLVRTSSSASQDDEDDEEEEDDKDEDEKPDDSGRTAAADSLTWPKTKLMDVSLVSDLFQGSLLSAVECSECSNVSKAIDPFYDLSLEIPSKNQLKRLLDLNETEKKKSWGSSFFNMIGISSPSLSLNVCLQSFCSKESLIKLDQYKCEKCKMKVNAYKSLSICRLPQILCIHIKRFAHNSYWGSKLTNPIEFPLQGLDMSPYMSESVGHVDDSDPAQVLALKQSTIYDLIGVVTHMGSVSGGHYIAYARHHLNRKWYEFDDRAVRESSEEQVLNAEAYVLMYRRRDGPTQDGEETRLQRERDLQELLLQRSSEDDASSDVLLSLYWLKKAELMSSPGRVDNWSLCCAHAHPLPLAECSAVSLRLSRSAWTALVARYGGGPLVPAVESGEQENSANAACTHCLARRRQRERKTIEELSERTNETTSAPARHYLISEEWLRSWRQFLSGGAVPGPICNELLLNGPDANTPKKGLKRIADYRGVSAPVWRQLLRIYGGGPEIIRNRIDLYEDEDEDEDEEEQDEDAPSEPKVAID